MFVLFTDVTFTTFTAIGFLNFSVPSSDDVACLSSPEDDLYERRQQRWDAEGQNDDQQMDSLIRERWSSATLKVLSSMPSRTIGRYCRQTVITDTGTSGGI